MAVYAPSFSDGGVERNMVLLASGFADLGVPTDLLISGKGEKPFLERLSPRVNQVWLPTRPSQRLLATIAYLRTERPSVLVSAKQRDDEMALVARRRAGVATKVFLRCGSHLSARPRMKTRNPLRRLWHHHRVRALYREADGVVCVSEGVAADLLSITDLPMERVAVIRNPVITPDLTRLVNAPVSHSWFDPGQPPVILGVGALARVKRFDDLLRAFARVVAVLDCRLVILGQGKERERLLRLAAELGVASLVDLPGFVGNVYPYMRAAAVLVLSSEREGAPNVLAEAMACGTPVVATDCPSGPREILSGGRYGPLVPVGNVDALHDAVLSALRNPVPPHVLRAALEDYTLEKTCHRYLRVFGLEA